MQGSSCHMDFSQSKDGELEVLQQSVRWARHDNMVLDLSLDSGLKNRLAIIFGGKKVFTSSFNMRLA